MLSQTPTSSLVLFFLLIIAQQSFAGEVCYGSLGCFSDDFPFTSPRRPIAYLPWSPEDIGTTFRLFTRFNQFSYQLLSYKDPTTIQKSIFNPFRRTKFIIHGFNTNSDASWIATLKNSLLNVENLNVIAVDWRKGASTQEYGQAATNTRVVGAEIAELISVLRDNTGALYTDFHLIGHSLGSHISGYAGEKMANLGRITGLDPAGPYFEGTPFNVRLDRTDARYVDAIHTDSNPIYQLGFGMVGEVGHADFYPNGGYDQPGCPGNEVSNGQWWRVSCSHSRAHQLMIDSIINNAINPMLGYPCSSYEEYKTGACNNKCIDGGCPKMGYYSDEISNAEDLPFFLTTGTKSPYAKY